MKVQLKKVITGIRNEPIKHGGGELTVKEALLLALTLPNPDSKGSTADEAVKTRKLFNRLDAAEDEIELKSDDVVKLKDLLAKRLSEVVAGAVILELEPEE
jgi:hypothetical protein